jgi:hypothetical protein
MDGKKHYRLIQERIKHMLKKYNWRQLPKYLVYGLATLILLIIIVNLPSTKEKRELPNVLLIICDDLNDAVEGMGGHPQTITPNINRLASKGVLFTNAHSNAPLCAPSRASLLTGLYPHTTGYYSDKNNWKHFIEKVLSCKMR